MKSVLQDTKECYVCGTTFDIQEHHIFHGTANRTLSEKYGMKIYLCQEHHTGATGIHHNQVFNNEVKQMAQAYWEANMGTREAFMGIFGRNYLDTDNN